MNTIIKWDKVNRKLISAAQGEHRLFQVLGRPSTPQPFDNNHSPPSEEKGISGIQGFSFHQGLDPRPLLALSSSSWLYKKNCASSPQIRTSGESSYIPVSQLLLVLPNKFLILRNYVPSDIRASEKTWISIASNRKFLFGREGGVGGTQYLRF